MSFRQRWMLQLMPGLLRIYACMRSMKILSKFELSFTISTYDLNIQLMMAKLVPPAEYRTHMCLYNHHRIAL